MAIKLRYRTSTYVLQFRILVTCLFLLSFLSFRAQTSAAVPTGNGLAGQPLVVLDVRHDLSRPLRLLSILDAFPVTTAADLQLGALPRGLTPRKEIQTPQPDQTLPLTASMPSTLVQWEGISNRNGVVPPDTNGDVGPNHYVQWVNLSLQVWNKSGVSLLGPLNGNAVWSGFGGYCEFSNSGDPIVLYDSLADRWFISQFAIPSSAGPFYQCIAISQTPDPTGAWYRYAYLWSTTRMNDYPKFGVWPDGYYMSVNQFANASTWAGAGVAVFERSKMLLGQSARMISYDLYSANVNFGGLLPADLDGSQTPPAGSPNPFLEWDDASVFGGVDALRLWEFHVDWTNPALSTFGDSLQPDAVIPTLDVEPRYGTAAWITQPGTSQTLDQISDRLMHRIQFRRFGDTQVLVGNHTVDTGNYHAGIHWFELHRTGDGNWSLYQEGLYAPDANHRWMGSIAMDGSRNLALGFSLSGPATFPSIAYAGRLVDDPLGQMAQGEALVISGSNTQAGSSRWGDYSMMSLDPSDDCTFWYTQQYYSASGGSAWRTRIGAFRFPTCGLPDTGTLQGIVRASVGGAPIAGAEVEANGVTAVSGIDGVYRMTLPAGQVSVKASAFGYLPKMVAVMVRRAQTTVLDFSLSASPMSVVSGIVSDGSGHPGMPLYARIDIPAYPGSPLFTDPFTGYYQVELMQDVPFSFTVTAELGGYQSSSRSVTPLAGGIVENFALVVNNETCDAPGYQAQPEPIRCQPVSGGLVGGFVRDTNNPPNPLPLALAGASVSNVGGGMAVTRSEPPGLYLLFAPPGQRTLAASFTGYSTLNLPVTVNPDTITRLDFNLPAGYITVTPSGPLVFHVPRFSNSASASLNFQNLGSAPATWTSAEFNGSPPDIHPTGPFAAAGRRLSPNRLDDLSAEKVYPYLPPLAEIWPEAGQVVRSWDAELASPWGIAITKDGQVWVADTVPGGGDGQNHAFTSDGVALDGRLPATWGTSYGADLAYDPLRNRLWQVSVGLDNCIYELDPLLGAATGQRICPPFGSTQRGLAYDPVSDTFYSGTWNDAILSHFDRQGLILDSVNLGLNIAGLAYHPISGHLYIFANANTGFDVYVVNPHNGYAVLGGFEINGMTPFGQAGLEFAADGHLWAVDQEGGQVMEVATGEIPAFPWADVAWVNIDPSGAYLAAGDQKAVTVQVDPAGLTVGSYTAYFTVITDTPYDATPYKAGPVEVILEVLPGHGVSLEPASQLASGWSGGVARFKVQVTNIGDYTETYMVTIASHSWVADVPTAIGPMAAGAVLDLWVSINIPAGTPLGQSESVTVTVTSSNDPSSTCSVILTAVTGYASFYPFVLR